MVSVLKFRENTVIKKRKGMGIFLREVKEVVCPKKLVTSK